MTRPLLPLAALGLATAGLLVLGTAVPTSAGYVDEASATAALTTAPGGAYLPTDLNRSVLTAAALSGGVVYLWGAKGGGLAGNGKWNVAADGVSDRSVLRVDLPITSDPATAAPVKVKQVALNSSLYAATNAEYTAGATGAALTEGGEVYTWGTNRGGKLGTGNADTTAICNRGREAACSSGPILTGIRTITASSNAFYALTAEGDLYGWGTAVYETSASAQVTTGEFGKDGVGTPITTLSRPTLLKSGVAETWAAPHGRFDLSTAGALTFSGYGSPSATTPATGAAAVDQPMPTVTAATGADRIVDVQAVPTVAVARTASGALYSWGTSSPLLGRGYTAGSTYQAPGRIVLGAVADVALGARHADAVLADGSVVGWGIAFASEGNTDAAYAGSQVTRPRALNNAENKNNPTPTGTDNIAVSAMPHTTFLTKSDYSVSGWGDGAGPYNLLLPGVPRYAWSAVTGVQLYIAPIGRLALPGIG